MVTGKVKFGGICGVGRWAVSRALEVFFQVHLVLTIAGIMKRDDFINHSDSRAYA